MLISMAILTIIMVMISPMLDISFSGIVSYEVHNSLKQANQTAINKLGHTLTETHRMFLRTEADPLDPTHNFLGRVEFDGQPPGYIAGNAGNSLFFVGLGRYEDVDVDDDIAADDDTWPPDPDTVFVKNVRVDTYQFHYYYLGRGTQGDIANRFNRNLWEWHSIAYANVDALSSYTAEEILEGRRVLYSRGYRFAYNPAELLVNNAFIFLNVDGTFTADPGHQIRKASGGELVRIHTTGIISNYRYGVAPNTNNTDFVLTYAVPKFASPNGGDYPSGFEVAVAGPSSRRQVFTRLVLVAEGAFKGHKSNEQVLLTSTRDNW